MLLRMVSLNSLDKVAKRFDFHPTILFTLICFDKDQNFTGHDSTPLDSLDKVAKRLDFPLDFFIDWKIESFGRGLS